MYLLGYDIGSSSIKATILDAGRGRVAASATSPKKEMEISAPIPGWAEQDPEVWWKNLKAATAEIKSNFSFDPKDVKAIGISYQMHGLVIVDKNKKVLRPSIIWCDSRAVDIGRKASRQIGEAECLKQFLNSPGNFTASKLKWVMENEPEIYKKIYKIMLPGDYIAMRMTDRIATTPSGLSEGIMWDFQHQKVADTLLDYYGINAGLLAEVLPTFSVQGQLTTAVAEQLGLAEGTVVSYRAGDQPNNALSLNVLKPGEIASTAGTSAVVYGIADKPNYDEKSRVNTFVHVNYSKEAQRYGVLMCLNGAGSLNRWLRHNTGEDLTYDGMNELAQETAIGSDGLVVLPYGNGAERTLENTDTGCVVNGLNFNIHNRAHLFRAAQEGIVFALNYGLGIMRDMGVEVKTVRAGHANMFLSPLFARIFATITGAVVELYNTDGSAGAARGAGIGARIYKNSGEAFETLERRCIIEPAAGEVSEYKAAYERWLAMLNNAMAR